MIFFVKNKTLITVFYLLAMLAMNVNATEKEEPVSTAYLSKNAIGKHDTTAYHSDKAAVKGDKQFIHEWKGAKWHFATQAQRDLFAANPEKYSPAYNGFCSNALTLGEGLVRTNGKVWHIFGDQLHLFFAERGRVRWVEGDYAKLKAQADKAWQTELSNQ